MLLRALIYIRLPERGADERGFVAMESIRQAQPPGKRLSQPRLKELFTEQFLLLKYDEDRAVRAIPALLPKEATQRRAALSALRRVVGASGQISPEGKQRLARIEAMFDGAEKAASKGDASKGEASKGEASNA